MSVTGAALGTVIAQFVTLIYLSYFYLGGKTYLKLRKRNLRLDMAILKPMFAIGVASFVQTVAGSLSALFIIRAVISYGGDIHLSAFGIIQRIMMFATMPAMVIGQGVQPILGFNYGARRFALVTKAFKISAISSTILSTAAFIVIFFIPGAIIGIFSSDPALIAAGSHASRLVFWCMPIMGFVMLGTNSFISLGKAGRAFITALGRPVLFMIPAVMILPRIWKIDGVFLSFPASDGLTLLLTIILLIPVFREFRQNALTEKAGPAGQLTPVEIPDETGSRTLPK
jgi:Na+-driven multidrug efflux pump